MQMDLADLIPDKSFYTSYVPRVYRVEYGEITDIEIIERAVMTKKNALLLGPTGPGKTSLYYAVCAKNDWPLGTANMNGQTTVEDLVGQIVPVARDQAKVNELIDHVVNARAAARELQAKSMAGSADAKIAFSNARMAQDRAELELDIYTKTTAEFVWADGLLVRLMKGDPRFEYTVFLADEINFSPAKVSAVLNGVTGFGREITVVQHQGDLVRATPGFHFGAAMNPSYEGTRDLNKAFRDRFHVQMFFDYDPVVEKTLFPNQTRLLEVAKDMREMVKTDTIQTPISTRMMKQYLENIETFGTVLAREFMAAHFTEDEQPAVSKVLEAKLSGGRGSARTPSMGNRDPFQQDPDEDNSWKSTS